VKNKSETERLYKQLVKRFVRWANTRSDIRGAIIVGSRARVDHPADEWADLDVIVITMDPEYYLATNDWLENIGSPLLTFVEPTAAGDEMERRVLFEGMLDVDFSIIPKEKVQQLVQVGIPPQIKAQIANVFGRGMFVLLDKDGTIAQLQGFISATEMSTHRRPSQQKFLEVVNDFIYHSVWTTIKLCRGELWTAKECSDAYMKRLLLQMIEWHASAIRGWNYDTWFKGRFLEEWADPMVLKGLQNSFAQYNEEDIKRGLLATIDLFRRTAMETAERLGYSYPIEADECVTEWVRKRLSEK